MVYFLLSPSNTKDIQTYVQFLSLPTSSIQCTVTKSVCPTPTKHCCNYVFAAQEPYTSTKNKQGVGSSMMVKSFLTLFLRSFLGIIKSSWYRMLCRSFDHSVLLSLKIVIIALII